MSHPLAAALCSLLLLTTACATGQEDTESAPSLAETDQKLAVGALEDIYVLDPPEDADVAVRYPNTGVFETLVVMGPDFSIQPLLATEWEFREPGTWRFQLREGVAFHNGAPFNAEAVAYTVNERLGASSRSGRLGIGPGAAQVVDEYTVDISPNASQHRLLEELAHPSRAMVAPGTHPGVGTNPEDTPTGTGPFRFISYDVGETVVVERFDEYWGDGAGVQQITFRFMPDSNSRLLALQAGEVDAVYEIPRQQVSEFEDNPDFTVMRSGVGAYNALMVSVRGPAPYDLLSDLRLRQAVAYGIDKEAVVEDVWGGNAEVMPTMIPANLLGKYADEIEGYPHDPEEATRLLDEAGWVLGTDGVRTKDGRRLELTLVSSGSADEGTNPMPELVQAQLAEIGIELRTEVVGDSNLYSDRLEKGEGDLFNFVGNQEVPNPFFLGSLFTGVQPGGIELYGERFGPGPEFDDVFAMGYASDDRDESLRLAAEAMSIAIDESVSAIPIAGIYRIWALSSDLEGFAPHPSAQTQKWASVDLATE